MGKSVDATDKWVSRAFARWSREFVMDRADGKCEVCGFFCPWIGEVHHIVSVASGGSGEEDNLIYLCPNCHRVVEKIRTPIADNPYFENWIRESYDEDSAQRLIDLAYQSARNQV